MKIFGKGELNMKLKDLKDVLWSRTGKIQWCILYNWKHHTDVTQCSVEHAIEYYGDFSVRRIYSCYEDGQDYLVIEL